MTEGNSLAHKIFKDGIVDVTELEKYFKLVIDVQTRTTNDSNNIIIPFRQCTM